MVEGIFTKDERIRLEAMAHAVAKNSHFSVCDTENITQDAVKFEAYIRGEDQEEKMPGGHPPGVFRSATDTPPIGDVLTNAAGQQVYVRRGSTFTLDKVTTGALLKEVEQRMLKQRDDSGYDERIEQFLFWLRKFDFFV